jgi:hypothetical protein
MAAMSSQTARDGRHSFDAVREEPGVLEATVEGCREEVNIPQVLVEYVSVRVMLDFQFVLVTPFVPLSYHSKQIFQSRNLF